MITTTLMTLCLLVQAGPLKKATRDNPPAEAPAETSKEETKAELKPSDGSC